MKVYIYHLEIMSDRVVMSYVYVIFMKLVLC